MNEKNNLVKKLEHIKQLLQLKKDYSNDQLSIFLFIENIIEKKTSHKYTLPIQIKNFLTFTSNELLLESLIDTTFIPFNLQSLTEEFSLLLDGFKSKDIESMPVILTQYAEKKILDENDDWENEENKYIQLLVTEPYRFIPLYNGGFGSFIFYDSLSEQLIFSDNSDILEWRVLAPSLNEHIEDLISGISNDYYDINFEYDEVVFPYSWFLRQLIKKGQYVYN